MEINMWGANILINLLMIFEYYSFFYVFFRRDYRKEISKIRIVALGVLWFTLMLAGFDWLSRLAGPVPAFFIAFIFLIWTVFEITLSEALLLGMANWLFLSLIEENVIIAVRTIYGLNGKIIDELIMAFISGCIWAFYFFSRGRYNAHAFRLSMKLWILLDLIMFILMCMLSFFTYVIVMNLPDNQMIIIGQNLLLVSGILIVVLLFVLVYSYGISYEYRIQNELSEAQIKQQREYYTHLLEREEETRKFRHDIINDLLEINNYCGKKECDRMRLYLEKIMGIVVDISKANYEVGNEVVNTMLNHYLIPILGKHEVEVTGHLPEHVTIDERDLCVIVGNMIRNAVEAVNKMDKGKIWVNLNFGKDYIFLGVKNTFEGDIAFDKNGLPETTKSDMSKHGIGMRNFLEVVSKNGGTYNLDAKNGMFDMEVFLKNEPFGVK